MYRRDALLQLATVNFYLTVGLFIITFVCLRFSSVLWLRTISGNQCIMTSEKINQLIFLLKISSATRGLRPSNSGLPLTCFRVRSISMPWFQGAAGLARQSPALPLREMSTFCLRRFLKASAITITPSYVSAEVYWDTRERSEGGRVTGGKRKSSVAGSFTS